MSTFQDTRIWLIRDEHAASLHHLKAQLEERGAVVEDLDISSLVGRLMRDRGESLVDALRGLVGRVRRAAEETRDEADEESSKALEGHLGEALERGRPDMIVVASSRYVRGFEMMSRFVGTDALRIGLLLDYNLNASWLKGAVNAYVVPHANLRRPLVDAGVDEGRVWIAGPCVAAPFADPPKTEELRASFGLSTKDGPISLILCDEFAEDDLDRLMFQCSLVERPFQPIVYAGSSASHSEVLRRAARRHGIRARMLPHVENLHDFIAVSDLVVAAPDSARTVGCMAFDRPLLIAGPTDPDQSQTRFLVDQGAAWHTEDLLRLGADLEFALASERLERVREASSRFGHPTGTLEVVDALADILERRAEFQGSSEGDAATTQGPFEMIGASNAPRSASSSPFQTIGSEHTPPTPPKPTPEDPHYVPAQPSTEGPPEPNPAPPLSPLSAAEAKDQLAALILSEKDIEKRLKQAQKDSEQWRNRLELAREWNEVDLAQEAERLVHQHNEDTVRLDEELARVLAQKDKLKARVRQGRRPNSSSSSRPYTPPPSRRSQTPDRFREMEVEQDLGALRERLMREMEDE